MTQSAALPGNADLYLHIRVLIGIILGLSVTRLVSGIASIVQHPKRYRIWSVHLGWVAWALVNVITFWWWEFRLSIIPHWTFNLYFFVCVYASMYFFLSALLFPQDLDGIHGVSGLLSVPPAVVLWVCGSHRSARCGRHLDQGGRASAVPRAGVSCTSVGIFILLCGVASITRNVKFHVLFVLGALVYEISFFARYYHTLNQGANSSL